MTWGEVESVVGESAFEWVASPFRRSLMWGRPFAVLEVKKIYRLPNGRRLTDAVFSTPERNGQR